MHFAGKEDGMTNLSSRLQWDRLTVAVCGPKMAIGKVQSVASGERVFGTLPFKSPAAVTAVTATIPASFLSVKYPLLV